MKVIHIKLDYLSQVQYVSYEGPRCSHKNMLHVLKHFSCLTVEYKYAHGFLQSLQEKISRNKTCYYCLEYEHLFNNEKFTPPVAADLIVTKCATRSANFSVFQDKKANQIAFLPQPTICLLI